jgi:hypothetical protein
MMNKTKRFSIAAALAASCLLAAALLLASCADALSPATGKAADETTAPGTGLVRVVINVMSVTPRCGPATAPPPSR